MRERMKEIIRAADSEAAKVGAVEGSKEWSIVLFSYVLGAQWADEHPAKMPIKHLSLMHEATERPNTC